MGLEALRKIDLFHNLNSVQLAHLASITEERSVPKGTVLFREGDAPEMFYIIGEGRVRISKEVPGIGEEALAIVNAGSYFGEMEIIDDQLPRAAMAVAHENCTLHVIKIADFHTLLGTDNELALALLWSIVRTLASRLRATNDKVTAMFAMAQFGN